MLGPNWTQTNFSGGTNVIINNSDFGAINGEGMSYWNANPAVVPGYACAQLSGVGTAQPGWVSVCLGVDANNSGEGVCCQPSVLFGTTWEMVTRFNGATSPVDAGSSPTFVTGDYVGIQRTDASTYQCYRSTNGTTWTNIDTVTGLNFPNPGFAGADAIAPANNWTLETWEMGAGTLPTSRACGTP